MQKRHVNHGDTWMVDEEQFALYTGYLDLVKQQGLSIHIAAREIAKEFPSDRGVGTINLKLQNHQWWDTNGLKGRDELNDWGKAYWKTVKSPEEFEALLQKQSGLRAIRKARRT